VRFNYQARTKEGEIQTGTVEASSYEVAVNTIQGYDLTVISLEAISAIPFYTRSLKFFQKVKAKELVLFYRQLAILFEADNPLLDSLRALSEGIRNPYFKNILFEVETDIRGGESLSKSLARHKKVFPPFYINVIHSCEVTGKLSDVLKYLADHAEEDFILNSKIKGAFIYPIFILSTFVVIATILLVYVVPQLTTIFVETGQELPMLTKILIGASAFLRSWIWLLIIIGGGLVFGFIRFKKTSQGQELWDKFKLKIPVLGKLFRKMYITRFSENFSTLIKGGLPILSALKISSQVIGNTVFSNLINEAIKEVKTGGKISSVFEKSEEIPTLVIQMLKVGEETAKLDSILEKTASFYRGEVDRAVDNITQLIEPILIVIMGVGVAFLVASILMPIYSMSGF